jgi:HK97 family phage prohead protease
MNNNRIEKRFIGMDVVAEMSGDDNPIPIIRGIAPVFNAISEVLVEPGIGIFRELIEPGALDTIMGTLDVRGRFDHKVLLGRTKSGTMTLNRAEAGLEYTIFVNPNDPEAMAAYEKVRRNDADGSSFMFTVAPNGEKWEVQDDGIPLRRVQVIDELMDVGPVTFPAYPQTSANARSKVEELRQQQQTPPTPEDAGGEYLETDQKAEKDAQTLALMAMEIELDEVKE